MLLGPGLAAWAARLDQENGNMRAARRWCAEDPARADAGLRLAAGLYQWWTIRGHLATRRSPTLRGLPLAEGAAQQRVERCEQRLPSSSGVPVGRSQQ